MQPIINGRFLQRKVTGVERAGREILRILGDNLRVARPGKALRGWRGHAWEQFILPGELQPGMLLWSPANTGPLAIRNQVVTVHDLSPLEHPEWFAPAFSVWYRVFLPVLIRQVKCIIVPSEYVRRRMLERFSLDPLKVVCVPQGVDGSKFHPRAAARQPYVLFVGTLEPRKNLAGLLKAWNMIRSRYPRYRLVLAGESGGVFGPSGLDSQPDSVQLTGRVADEDLPGLYAGAELFILPSFDEGFGLTALEAMACGTPVIASRRGALPELIGNAGLFFDPSDPEAIADAIGRCLSEPGLRAALGEKALERADEYSWSRTANGVWQVLQTCT